MKHLLLFLCTGALLIWLPVAACCRTNTDPDHSGGPEKAGTGVPANLHPDSVYTYLALGDSYTIGTSGPLSASYPEQAVAGLKQRGYQIDPPEIIAENGWTTSDLMLALEGKKVDKPYSLVTLLIGVNNQYQGGSLEDYRGEFAALLKKSIRYAGGRPEHVIVLSIPDYSVTPFGQGRNVVGTRAQIDSFNRANREICDSVGALYVNVTEESRKVTRDRSLVAADGLHYTRQEYANWVTLMLPLAASQLNN